MKLCYFSVYHTVRSGEKRRASYILLHLTRQRRSLESGNIVPDKSTDLYQDACILICPCVSCSNRRGVFHRTTYRYTYRITLFCWFYLELVCVCDLKFNKRLIVCGFLLQLTFPELVSSILLVVSAHAKQYSELSDRAELLSAQGAVWESVSVCVWVWAWAALVCEFYASRRVQPSLSNDDTTASHLQFHLEHVNPARTLDALSGSLMLSSL